MIVLGIDPGTARMGYGILEVKPKKVAVLLHSGVIVTSPDLEAHYRLKFLYKNLTDLIKAYSPSTIVIERLFFNTNAKTAIAVGQARGMVLLAAADKKLDVVEYTALEAKRELTGYGRADKKEMQVAVKDVLGLDTIIKSDDANDAVAMALCFLKKNKLF